MSIPGLDRTTDLLPGIDGPAALRRLAPAELVALAHEVRDVLVTSVCRTGGHLGPNLGVVEVTMALHRVFDSPQDALVFDTGHQAYVHKMLTGRSDLTSLRQRHGLSGYPSRQESAHDLVENSHASTSLSYADGLGRAFALTGQHERWVVPVVGDGAMTGGMVWEGLNNLAANPHRRVVVVLNDNGRSYDPTVGGLAAHLAGLRRRDGDASLFESLGLGYVGPVDGHDVAAVERSLREARLAGRPVVVHVVTRKGHGYAPAERDPADRMHGIGRLDPVTGRPRQAAPPTWTDVFGATLRDIAAARSDVVAVSAAMVGPVGLRPVQAAFPDRVHDVGIAEQHAVTCAAGMSSAGLHPVVALYATFANRAVDQLLLDAALHGCRMTLALDRAGLTGDDGPSHHGTWDLALLGPVPGLRIAAPRDATRLQELLWEAVDVSDGPCVVRYPKSLVDADVPAVEVHDGLDVLARTGGPDVLLVPVGPLAKEALAAALGLTGLGVTVVDPRWPVPVPPALLELAAQHRLVVTVEDGARTGGFGALLGQALADAGIATPLRALGVPRAFQPHGTRTGLLSELGLDAPGIAAAITSSLPAR